MSSGLSDERANLFMGVFLPLRVKNRPPHFLGKNDMNIKNLSPMVPHRTLSGIV